MSGREPVDRARRQVQDGPRRVVDAHHTRAHALDECRVGDQLGVIEQPTSDAVDRQARRGRVRRRGRRAAPADSRSGAPAGRDRSRMPSRPPSRSARDRCSSSAAVYAAIACRRSASVRRAIASAERMATRAPSSWAALRIAAAAPGAPPDAPASTPTPSASTRSRATTSDARESCSRASRSAWASSASVATTTVPPRDAGLTQSGPPSAGSTGGHGGGGECTRQLATSSERDPARVQCTRHGALCHVEARAEPRLEAVIGVRCRAVPVGRGDRRVVRPRPAVRPRWAREPRPAARAHAAARGRRAAIAVDAKSPCLLSGLRIASRAARCSGRSASGAHRIRNPACEGGPSARQGRSRSETMGV